MGDIFRSRDLGGWAKALWSIFVIVMSFLGVFVYLIARGQAMSERDLEAVQARQEAFQSYVRDAASTGGSADELLKLADPKERGVISEAEFAKQKEKVLA